MKTEKLVLLLTAHCLLLTLFGCQNPFESPRPETPAGGTGYFSLAIERSTGRTIMPTTVQDDFYQYKLEFFTAGTTTDPVKTVTRNNNNLSDPVELDVGTYDLRVSAYLSSYTYDPPSAQGSLSNIVIGAGEIVTRNVTFGPIRGEGTGKFSWDISFETPNNVVSASMSITPLDTTTGTAAQSINLKNTSNSSATLNSGYYRVVFKLYNNEKLSLERREILHIYQNMESAFACTFNDSQFVNDIWVTTNADSGPGSLRQALAEAPEDSTIVIDSSVGIIALRSRIEISRSVNVEGNGVTITRDASWTTVDTNTQLLYITSSGSAIISRIHFKDGRVTEGGAIYNVNGDLSLESCIFSGNQGNGAIYSYGYNGGGTLDIKGCTFYGNSSSGNGGAILIYYGMLTLEGNLFNGNTTGSVDNYYGEATVISNGYNVGVDGYNVGWNLMDTDKNIDSLPISPLTFRLLFASEAANVIDSLSVDYPAFDFYGDPITEPAAAGAVQATVSGSGYVLAVSVNNSAKGSANATPAPSNDGLISGTVTIAAAPNEGCSLAYWLVDGLDAGSGNPLSLNTTDHTTVQAVFTQVFIVNNFTDTSNSEATPGTLRHAITNLDNGDIIRFTGVTPGQTTIALNSRLEVSKSVTIEGNGVTITRDPSWTTVYYDTQLLYISYATVTISRIHFKDGRAINDGVICNDQGNLSLEFCIFSGNESNAIILNNYPGTMRVKGCTFFWNNAYSVGAIYSTGGTLTFEGNLFDGTPPGSVVISYDIISNGYNVAKGWSGGAATDKNVTSPLVSPVSFKPLYGGEAVGVIDSLPTGYPAVDFYGNPITVGAAAGAVQQVTTNGYYLELTVNNSDRGSVNTSSQPDDDGIFSSGVTLTAVPSEGYEFGYWLVDGSKKTENPWTPVSHASVKAVFVGIFEVSIFTDAEDSATTPGTLRHAIANADDDIIRLSGVTPGQTIIALTGRLDVNKNITIEGNGITITRDASWDTVNNDSQLMCIGSGIVSISRVHFKDGRGAYYGAAIYNRGGNLTLESCIFSGGNSFGNYGAICNFSYGTMSVKGCTFSGNNCGAIYVDSGTLTLEGNLFYGNSYAVGIYYGIVGGVTVTSLGYNVGWVGIDTDKDATGYLVSPITFKPLYGGEAVGVIDSLSEGYPAVDFYGNPITNGAAAGAVQQVTPNGSYYIELTVNHSDRGSANIAPAPNADGLVPGTVTITATPAENCSLAYWLVNGENTGSANPLSLNITDHSAVQAVFFKVFIVNNFTDEDDSATTPGTLRHAITNMDNDDIIRFSGVQPGSSVVQLTSALPDITKNVSIEGNGVTITRDTSWTTIDNYSQLLRIYGGTVTISRIHFKDGRAVVAAAIYNPGGNVSLESCIFSGNQSAPSAGGAIYNYGPMSVKGCTFYNNRSTNAYGGGAIYNNGGTLTLEGNLFYGNTASIFSVTNSGTSLGYNVVDVALGTANNQSGFAAVTGDIQHTGTPFTDTTTFGPVPALHTILPGTPSEGFPATDFYGYTRNFPGAPGAVSEEYVSNIQYTVTFNSNGGSSVSSQTITIGNKAQKPADPTKTGSVMNIFKGWYINEGLTSAFDFDTLISANTTLYAKWDFPYDLGGVGPGGGKIFYRSEAGFTMTDNDEVCHYLEAAPNDAAEGLIWMPGINADYFTYDLTHGTSQAIGAGRKNTALILDYYSGPSGYSSAAKACNDYSNNGKTDWFLPSSNELTELYNNRLYADNLADAYSNVYYYWSSYTWDFLSVQTGPDYYVYHRVTCIEFRQGSSTSFRSDDTTAHVRPIRAF